MMLLVAAMIGLVGQETGFARDLAIEPAVLASDSAMTLECAEMMGLTKQNPPPAEPCEGMTPDCIAKMGCALPVAMLPSFASGLLQVSRAENPQQLPVPPLVGRTSGPEPEPPTRLG